MLDIDRLIQNRLQAQGIAPPATLDYLRAIKVVPGFKDLHGKVCSLDDLIGIIRRYARFEWLSLLSRLQTLIAPPNHQSIQTQREAVKAVVGNATLERLSEFVTGKPNEENIIFCTSTQLETLQQLVFLHADSTCTRRFEISEDYDNFCDAVFMAWDLSHPQPTPKGTMDALPILIQDKLRWQTTNIYDYSSRAFYFYQLSLSQKHPCIQRLMTLFEIATGYSLVDYVMGGLCVTVKECVLSAQQLGKGWGPTISPEECQKSNPDEARCLRAFHDLRCASPETIRNEIVAREEDRGIEEFNYIGLRSYPLVNLGEVGRFINNLSNALDSVFSGVRHSILREVGGRITGDPKKLRQHLGDLYGTAYEIYALNLLFNAFGGSLFRVPFEKGAPQADGVIALRDTVIVFEIKARYPRLLHYLGPRTLSEREDDLRAMGVEEAAEQIASTIDGIRHRGLLAEALGRYNWQKTPVIPAIITLDALPRFAGSRYLYDRLTQPILRVSQGYPTASVRFLSAGDIEELPDFAAQWEAGTQLYSWSQSWPWSECPFGSFISVENLRFSRTRHKSRVFAATRFLASTLKLDEKSLVLE